MHTNGQIAKMHGTICNRHNKINSVTLATSRCQKRSIIPLTNRKSRS